MTGPTEFELLELATPYALDAVTGDERADIERRIAAAPAGVAAAFHDEVRAVREIMAEVSATTAMEPPAELRVRVLAAVQTTPSPRKNRWRPLILAAAAVLAIGLAAVGVGVILRPAPSPTTAEQIFAAPDVRTVSGALPAGGIATVVFSDEKDAGVLVMNDVPPPPAGNVYQMWLVGSNGSVSAGTMTADDVGPTTKAVIPHLDHAAALAFTVEPGRGSQQPTSAPFAELPLT